MRIRINEFQFDLSGGDDEYKITWFPVEMKDYVEYKKLLFG